MTKQTYLKRLVRLESDNKKLRIELREIKKKLDSVKTAPEHSSESVVPGSLLHCWTAW